RTPSGRAFPHTGVRSGHATARPRAGPGGPRLAAPDLLRVSRDLAPSHGDSPMYRFTLALCLILIAGYGSTPGRDRDPAPKERPKTKAELMKRKLELGQQLLASLTGNDLAKAGKEASELLAVRKEIAWKVIRSEMYEALSDDFARSAQQIVKAAKDDNLEAAKLAYLGMTMSCFNCHAYVRDKKDVAAPRPMSLPEPGGLR
ncbi:MAG: hypothetical protein ACRC33_30285, partial [Gemmataceae bacterium]